MPNHPDSTPVGLDPEDVRLLAIVPHLAARAGIYGVAHVARRADEDRYRFVLHTVDDDGPHSVELGEAEVSGLHWPAGSAGPVLVLRDGTGTALVRFGPTLVETGRVGLPYEVRQAAWSPDGSAVALVARYAGVAEDPVIARRLDDRAEGIGWRQNNPHRLVVVDLVTGALTERPLPVADVLACCWAPDARGLAAVVTPVGDTDLTGRTAIWLLPDDAPPHELTTDDGEYAAVGWTARTLFAARTRLVADGPGPHELVEVDTGTGVVAPVSLGVDGTIVRAPLTVHGDAIGFVIELAGSWVPLRVHDETGAGRRRVEPLRREPGEVTALDWSDWGETIVSSTPTAPAEVLARRAGEEWDRVSDLHAELHRSRRLAAPVPLPVTVEDGVDVPAWIIRPDGASRQRPVPLLLCVHGGPHDQYGHRFFDEFQVLARAGYGVAFGNPRGSSGYGAAWARAIAHPRVDPAGRGWGDADLADLLAIVESATARHDWIDPDRVAILGGSYGGYLTAWAIGRTRRFAAAVMERGVSNLVSMSGTTDIPLHRVRYFGATHLQDHDSYWDRSPLRNADQVATPTLIVHSGGDLRCPVGQAQEFFTALRMRGVPSELVIFRDGNHALSRAGRPDLRTRRFEIILDWLQRHLRPRGAGPARVRLSAAADVAATGVVPG